MADKLTIKDYVDYFGDKSAMSDDVLDQLFGTIKSREDYMESQRGQAMTPEMMQLIMGAVEPGGGIKTAGKAVAKGPEEKDKQSVSTEKGQREDIDNYGTVRQDLVDVETLVSLLETNPKLKAGSIADFNKVLKEK